MRHIARADRRYESGTSDKVVNEPTHLDLFSGIGGFALAARWAGFKTVGFCEQDRFCQKVIAKHWPGIQIHEDICKLDGRQYAEVDLLTGGFPCQPFSFAGKRKGASDDRALWPEMFRVITQARPGWVLGENVAGIVSMELDRVLSDLESLGYSARAIVIPACAVDAKHRRSRVWIVANACSKRGRGWIEAGRRGKKTSFRSEAVGHSTSERRGEAWEYRSQRAAQRIAESSETLADANEPRSQGWNGEELRECRTQCTTRTSSPFIPHTANVGRHERNQNAGSISEGKTAPEERSRPSDYCRWELEPELGRVANGIPNRSHRLKGLGNATIPQVAEVILREIFKILRT